MFCCLLQAGSRINKLKIIQETERACINHALRFSRDDFVIGHLDFIVKKFNVNVQRIVDNIYFYKYIKKIKASPKIRTEVKKINL